MPCAHAERHASVKAATQCVWASAVPAPQHKSTQLYMPRLLDVLWNILAAICPVGFSHTCPSPANSLYPLHHLHTGYKHSVDMHVHLCGIHKAASCCRFFCTTSRCTVWILVKICMSHTMQILVAGSDVQQADVQCTA